MNTLMFCTLPTPNFATLGVRRAFHLQAATALHHNTTLSSLFKIPKSETLNVRLIHRFDLDVRRPLPLPLPHYGERIAETWLLRGGYRSWSSCTSMLRYLAIFMERKTAIFITSKMHFWLAY